MPTQRLNDETLEAVRQAADQSARVDVDELTFDQQLRSILNYLEILQQKEVNNVNEIRELKDRVAELEGIIREDARASLDDDDGEDLSPPAGSRKTSGRTADRSYGTPNSNPGRGR